MSLWNREFSVQEIKTPFDFLKEQGKELERMTNGIIISMVSVYKGFFDAETGNDLSRVSLKSLANNDVRKELGHGGESSWFIYEFSITSVGTPRYRYRAFVVKYNISIYPVKLAVEASIAEEIGLESIYEICDTEADFVEVLSKILNSSIITNLVNNLLSINVNSKLQNGG